MHSSQTPAVDVSEPRARTTSASGSPGSTTRESLEPHVRLHPWTLSHHQDLLAISALLIVIAIKAWERLRYPEWLGRTDILNQYLPWWSFLGRELRSGNIPGWNPFQLAGTPFLGDPQSGWAYLPVMIPFTFLDPLTAMKTYVVLQLLIAGLTTYWFARVLRFGPIPALGAALAYVLGPFLTYNTYCCNIQAHAATWIPLGLLGIELAVQANTWHRRILGWSLSGFAVSQVLAGWMGQGAYLTLILLGSYLTYRVITRDGKIRISRTVVGWLAAHSVFFLVIAFGLGAAALLPRLDVIQYTNLNNGSYIPQDGPTGSELSSMLSRMLGPNFDQRRTTIGAGTLALAMIGAVVAWRRAPVPFFVVQSVVVLTLSLRSTPLHELFYLLPRFQEIHDHAPSRALGVLMIGPAILAAGALEAIPKLSFRRGWLTAAIPLTGLGLMVLGMKPAYRTLERIGPATIMAFALVTLTVLLLVAGRRYWLTWSTGQHLVRLAPVVLLLVMVAEPGARDVAGHVRTDPVDPKTTNVITANLNPDDHDSAGDWLQEQLGDSTAPFRYLGYNAVNMRTPINDDGVIYQNRHWTPRYRRLLIGPRSMFLELYYFQGYNPVQLKNTIALFTTINGHPLEYHDAHVMAYGMSSPWLDVMGVRYILVPPTVAPGRPDLLHLNQRLQPVFDDGLVQVLENPGTFPNAWLVHDFQAASPGIALARVESGSVDASQIAILDPDVTVPEMVDPDDPASESVVVTTYAVDRIVYDVQADAAGIVVVGEIFNPGWNAYVDSEPVETLLVDGVLRGVPVGEGSHTLELRYEPRSINGGLGITGLTALALMVGLAVSRRRRILAPIGRI